MFFPSAFGIGLTGNFSAVLAAHAGLSEMGWEIQDLITRCYEIVFGGERGRKLNPLALMLLLVSHHSAACTAVIPMNIYYPNITTGPKYFVQYKLDHLYHDSCSNTDTL